ncbi:MAG: CAP domain-containing protein [Syntrophobacteraceae bacterium]|nr:CAP domain-containing protein [Syntrophobacteraceae bacterium]
MKCRWVAGRRLLLVLLGSALASSCAVVDHGRSWVPPPPPPRVHEGIEPTRPERARELFQLVRRENQRLQWDECLARVAHRRAREMALSGRFDHRDPRTGRNPVWDLVWECNRYRAAGENLVRGAATPREMHRALMDSRTHRENLLNPEYQLVGIGCYGTLCVQLFAGY